MLAQDSPLGSPQVIPLNDPQYTTEPQARLVGVGIQKKTQRAEIVVGFMLAQDHPLGSPLGNPFVVFANY